MGTNHIGHDHMGHRISARQYRLQTMTKMGYTQYTHEDKKNFGLIFRTKSKVMKGVKACDACADMGQL